MPIYTFKCPTCGRLHERTQSMAETSNIYLGLCLCSKNMLEFTKVIQAPAVIFKGNDWNDKKPV